MCVPMVDDPDSLILKMLREIRGKLDEHDARFVQIDGRFVRADERFEQLVAHLDVRFDDLEGRFDEMKLLVSHALGLSTANDIRLREHDGRLKSGEAWRQRVDQAVRDLTNRVGKLEEQGQS